MDALLAPLFGFLGFYVGTMFGLQAARWGLLLWVSTTTHGGDFLGPPKRRLLWTLPFIALLHPAPYLVGLLIVVTVGAAQGKVGLIWLWFLGGVYVYIVLGSMKMLQVYRRRQRASAGPSNRWRGP